MFSLALFATVVCVPAHAIRAFTAGMRPVDSLSSEDLSLTTAAGSSSSARVSPPHPRVREIKAQHASYLHDDTRIRPAAKHN